MYKLWRIFNALAEPADAPSTGDKIDPENEAAFPVAMHREEVDVVLQRLGAILKMPFVSGSRTEHSDEQIDFMKFVDIIRSRFLKDRDVHVISAAIGELYDEIVANVLKKVSFYFIKLLYTKGKNSKSLILFVSLHNRHRNSTLVAGQNRSDYDRSSL